MSCRRRQIDTSADETSLPLTDGEAVPDPVGDSTITGIKAAVVPQGLKGENLDHRCCDNPMMGMVRTRLRSRRGDLSDFFFRSSDGSTYEDADGYTLMMEAKQWTQSHSLNPNGIKSRRGGSGSKSTMRTMSVTVRILT